PGSLEGFPQTVAQLCWRITDRSVYPAAIFLKGKPTHDCTMGIAPSLCGGRSRVSPALQRSPGGCEASPGGSDGSSVRFLKRIHDACGWRRWLKQQYVRRWGWNPLLARA